MYLCKFDKVILNRRDVVLYSLEEFLENTETEKIFNRNSAFFSMCIYGESTATSKTIANLLANFFIISENK